MIIGDRYDWPIIIISYSLLVSRLISVSSNIVKRNYIAYNQKLYSLLQMYAVLISARKISTQISLNLVFPSPLSHISKCIGFIVCPLRDEKKTLRSTLSIKLQGLMYLNVLMIDTAWWYQIMVWGRLKLITPLSVACIMYPYIR